MIPDTAKHCYGPGSRAASYGIRTIPDPVLLLKASEVTKFDKKLWKTIAKMKACLIASHGIGLAAPQMGISERIILLKPSTTNNIRVMINPVITFTHDYKVDSPEGCLSVPGLYGTVQRYAAVRVSCVDEKNNPLDVILTGIESIIAQHEIDHLNGIMFYEKADPGTLEWKV